MYKHFKKRIKCNEHSGDFFLWHLATDLSDRLAISAHTHSEFLFQAASPDNGHCPRDRVARVYIFRGGGVFSRDVRSSGAGQEWWRKRSSRKREGAYCSEVILLDRGFRFPRRVRASYAVASVRVRVCVHLIRETNTRT